MNYPLIRNSNLLIIHFQGLESNPCRATEDAVLFLIKICMRHLGRVFQLVQQYQVFSGAIITEELSI